MEGKDGVDVALNGCIVSLLGIVELENSGCAQLKFFKCYRKVFFCQYLVLLFEVEVGICCLNALQGKRNVGAYPRQLQCFSGLQYAALLFGYLNLFGGVPAIKQIPGGGKASIDAQGLAVEDLTGIGLAVIVSYSGGKSHPASCFLPSLLQ